MKNVQNMKNMQNMQNMQNEDYAEYAEYAENAESYRKLVVRELSVYSIVKQIEDRKTADLESWIRGPRF